MLNVGYTLSNTEAPESVAASPPEFSDVGADAFIVAS